MNHLTKVSIRIEEMGIYETETEPLNPMSISYVRSTCPLCTLDTIVILQCLLAPVK